MEQNLKFINKSLVYGQLIFEKGPRQFNGEKIVFFQQMVLGKLDIHMLKNQFRSLPYTIHKNQLKMSHT